MSKRKRLNKLTMFLASKKGRLFFHVLYSVGASIVIIGALAKILHMPFGDILLIIGMVTEAGVFFLSAFDIDQIDLGDEPSVAGGGVAVIGGAGIVGDSANPNIGSKTSSGITGTTIIGGGGGIIGGGTIATGVAGGSSSYNPQNLSPEYVENMDNAAKELQDFSKTMTSLNEVSQSLLSAYQNITDGTQGLSMTSNGFSENVKVLNENIDSMNSIFASQMDSIKDQINTIKYINGSLERIKSLYDNTVIDSDAFRIENERMTRQIQELNRVYARLLQAMNVGGYNQGGGYGQGGGYNPPL